ncbi:hypothetical protein LJY25_07730 [Hymenobacter sp. BT175]|uniref:hypothetical protein n=1 Tax=Hymenobacter translucens TaxID=2886507 RepID=UPI001D0F0677|nr:hypothetical protein [Hymenobacter translucens]MCC2546330.1 hypothetical protein [Hymenobacter translucens]
MKNLLQSLAAGALLSFAIGSTSAQAQSTISGATQQGNGAYMLKTESRICITNTLLGVTGLGSCLDMNQEKFLITPSGHAMSVWKGVVPASARPAQRLVYNSTWTETTSDGVVRNYNTVAVTDPNGTITLTLTDKNNGKSKGGK